MFKRIVIVPAMRTLRDGGHGSVSKVLAHRHEDPSSDAQYLYKKLSG